MIEVTLTTDETEVVIQALTMLREYDAPGEDSRTAQAIIDRLLEQVSQ